MNEPAPSADTNAVDARRARLRWLLMAGGVAVALVAGTCYYLLTGRYVSTDDSSVQAAQTSISANVSGRVVELDVHDNQTVPRGEVLVRLDDRPLRIALEEAQAKLATARMQITAAKATYRQQLASLAAARRHARLSGARIRAPAAPAEVGHQLARPVRADPARAWIWRCRSSVPRGSRLGSRARAARRRSRPAGRSSPGGAARAGGTR